MSVYANNYKFGDTAKLCICPDI